METKKCNRCGIKKVLTEFWRNLNGYESLCKKCRMIRRYEQRLEKRKLEGKKTRPLTTRQVQELREQGLRYCPHCKRVLPLDNFSHTRGKKNNAPHCYECCREISEEGRNKEENRILRIEYYQNRKNYAKNQKLLRQYGITLEKYRNMLDFQKGKCIICGKTPAENKKELAVDHDHKTGKIRGLLCNNCNVAVGFLQDNHELALKIHSYLKDEV